MNPPCPRCHNRMAETRVPCDGHDHPWFVCLCGFEVVLINIKIPTKE